MTLEKIQNKNGLTIEINRNSLLFIKRCLLKFATLQKNGSQKQQDLKYVTARDGKVGTRWGLKFGP